MASVPTDLLEIMGKLDPRSLVDMPQEVADAFAQGQVQRIFRTSFDLPTAKNARGAAVSKFGDYEGSIYVQLKDGRTARFKNPEIAILGADVSRSGWKAKTGGIKERSPFFDQAHVLDLDKFSVVGSPERKILDSLQAANPTVSVEAILVHTAKHRVSNSYAHNSCGFRYLG